MTSLEVRDAARRGAEARPRRPLARPRARRGAAARAGAALELVPDRLPDPVGHATREERRRRRGRRHRRDPGGRRARRGEERGARTAKKGFFPSSMGLSFLAPGETRALAVTVRWGDYAPDEVEDADGKPVSVWQRTRARQIGARRCAGERERDRVRPRLRRAPAPRRVRAQPRRRGSPSTSRRARARSRSSS